MSSDGKYGSTTDELRIKAETKVAMQADNNSASSSAPDAKRLLYELQVHQAELEMQNEELQHIKAELLTENALSNELVTWLAQTSSRTTDEPFFNQLACHLAESLNMDFVCIDRLDGDGLTATTVAVWCDGHFEDNVSYALKDTPCGDVVGKTVCCFPAMVCRLFPSDQVLKDLQAESYIGVTLWGHSGKPIGLIAVISRRPLVNRSAAESLMKLVAVRAAGEIERLDAEEQLQRAHNELELRVRERTEELTTALRTLQAESAIRLQAVEALREKEQMLIHQSRQAAMGEMVGNIAHQWRQPLNKLGLLTQRVALFYDSPSFTKEFLDTSVANAMEIIQHMSKTIDDFREYYRPDKEKEPFSVREAIMNSLSLLEGNFQNPTIRVIINDTDDPVINGYKNEFTQVILNILINARDAIVARTPDDAQIIITLCNENGCPAVTVADNAGGIPDEIITKIFDPYFTTKGPQAGTGLGLFMSKAIIEKNMGGTLSVRNANGGAEFRIEMLIRELCHE